MIDLESLLSSISDDDMAKIKGIADSLMEKGAPEAEKPKEKAADTPDFPLNTDAISKIMSLMSQMNKEDYRTRLISDLKPMLSDERKQKADEAVKFLQLMEILPMLKGLLQL